MLGAVPLNSPTPHNLGTLFMTSYQIAIKLDEEFPEVAQTLGGEIGGPLSC